MSILKKNNNKFNLFLIISVIIFLTILQLLSALNKNKINNNLTTKYSNKPSSTDSISTTQTNGEYIYDLTIKKITNKDISYGDLITDFPALFNSDDSESQVYNYNQSNEYLLSENKVYFIKSTFKIDLQNNYSNDRYKLIISPNNSLDTRYLNDDTFCVKDDDCTIDQIFCSYGAINRYSPLITAFGCESGIYDFQEKYTFGSFDTKMKCESEVKYQNAKCTNNICTGQGRSIKCVGELSH